MSDSFQPLDRPNTADIENQFHGGKLKTVSYDACIVTSTAKKRLYSGIPKSTHKERPFISNNKSVRSINTLGQTDMLRDLVGMVGPEIDEGQERS